MSSIRTHIFHSGIMAITALPSATIHLLGSAQALTTPTSLVKELLDNSLDAKATSIDILISPNTIDKIEVRDNGHGIPQEDLDALGRRGHTSKLRSFDELKAIGGISLGFRGEALASAVQLGLVTVTTKTEGEPVATAVQLKTIGGIAKQSRISHPVGTTVSVTKFLHSLPVRRQVMEKEAAKTLKKVKELLQSYALARPQVRFCLKIMKGVKGGWSFNPRPHDGIKEAVSQVIGRDAATQCIEKYLSFSDKHEACAVSVKQALEAQTEQKNSEPGQTVSTLTKEVDTFLVEAFLPRSGATSIGHGQYLSVDSRPVAHEKGTMRRIAVIFKRYVKSSLAVAEDKSSDPFLRLNIKCPMSSYDPNVEPAKDDILFGNESLVLEAIEQLFKGVYGEPTVVPSTAAPKTQHHGDFELLKARNQKAPISADSPEIMLLDNTEDISSSATAVNEMSIEPPTVPKTHAPESSVLASVENVEEEVLDSRRRWSADMSTDYGEDVEGSQRSKQTPHNPWIGSSSAADVVDSSDNSLNPWTIAKMNVPLRQRETLASLMPSKNNNASSRASLSYLPTPQQSSDPVMDSHILDPVSLPQPRQIFNRQDFTTLDIPVMRPSHEQGVDGDEEHTAQPRSAYRRAMTAEPDDRSLFVGDDTETFRRRNDFNTARDALTSGMPAMPRHNSHKRPRGINKPFVSPMRASEEPMSRDTPRQTTITGAFNSQSRQPPVRQNEPVEELTVSTTWSSNPDLAWAMDFERRKEDATRQKRTENIVAQVEAARCQSKRRRMSIGDRGSCQEVDLTENAPRSSPHKNRYNAAVASLTPSQEIPLHDDEISKPRFETSLPDGDPRLYLMKRMKSSLAVTKQGHTPKPMRAKSTRLPLEKIPADEKVHMLMLNVSTSMEVIQNAMLGLSSSDAYVRRGNQHAGLALATSEADEVQKELQSIVEKWKETEAGKKYEVAYKFENLISVE